MACHFSFQDSCFTAIALLVCSLTFPYDRPVIRTLSYANKCIATRFVHYWQFTGKHVNPVIARIAQSVQWLRYRIDVPALVVPFPKGAKKLLKYLNRMKGPSSPLFNRYRGLFPQANRLLDSRSPLILPRVRTVGALIHSATCPHLHLQTHYI